MRRSRRSFVSAGLSFVSAVALPRISRAQSRPTIDVKKLGAFGDGRLPDLHQIREAIRQAADHAAGATVYFPPGDYYLGAADGGDLLPLRDVHNVRLVGERATLTCKTVGGRPTILAMGSTRNVTVEGLTFRDRALDREALTGAYAIGFGQADGPPSENVQVKDCMFESVLSAITTHGAGGAVKARGFTLTNLSVKHAVYGFNFADCGDDVRARNLRCDDVKRSYFPYGVSNHDVELDTRNNATGFTDVLIKCYAKDTYKLRMKVKCRGKRGGDAIVALDNQQDKGHGMIRDIAIDLDVDDADCALDRVVLVRSFDPNAKYERQTQNRWDNIFIDGNVHVCDSTKLIDVLTISKTPGHLNIGSRLARHPRLPSSIPGFIVSRAS